jgi:hypothetical protein
MSEFQYYEFVAIERRLTDEDQAALRRISSRAEITDTSLTNSYSYADFRGDPDALMDRYFDAMVYVTNFGTFTLRLRIPKASADLAAMTRYAAENGVIVRATKTHVVVTLSSEEEGGRGWIGEDGDGWMKKLLGLRAELMAGDYRPLYLGWLGAAFCGDVDEEEREPVVPPGLRRLTKAQRHLVDFLGLSDDLLEAAAKGSSGAGTAATPTRAALTKWVASLPAKQKDAWLVTAALDEGATVGATVLQRYRKAQPKAPTEGAAKARRRTVAELLQAAGIGEE